MRVGVVRFNSASNYWWGFDAFGETSFKSLEATRSHHVFIPLREIEYVDKVSKVNRQLNAFVQLKHLRTKVRATRFGGMVAAAVRVVRPPSDAQSPWSAQMDSWIREQQIEVVWFLGQSGGKISAPYITSVWDLAHRSQPYFPEVSITGWDWEGREQTFRSVLPRASFILTGTHAGKSEIVHYYG